MSLLSPVNFWRCRCAIRPSQRSDIPLQTAPVFTKCPFVIFRAFRLIRKAISSLTNSRTPMSKVSMLWETSVGKHSSPQVMLLPSQEERPVCYLTLPSFSVTFTTAVLKAVISLSSKQPLKEREARYCRFAE